MTTEEIKAALTLADAAKGRADRASPGPWDEIDALGGHGAEGFFGCGEKNITFVAAARSDVPVLADLVRRLADECLMLQAILSDATSESAMYEQGVRAALNHLKTLAREEPSGSVRTGLTLAVSAVRVLLSPKSVAG